MKTFILTLMIASIFFTNCTKDEVLTPDYGTPDVSDKSITGVYYQHGWIENDDTNWIDMALLVDTFKYEFYSDLTYDYEYISYENGLAYEIKNDSIYLDDIGYTLRLSENKDTLYLGGWVYDWSIFIKE